MDFLPLYYMGGFEKKLVGGGGGGGGSGDGGKNRGRTRKDKWNQERWG